MTKKIPDGYKLTKVGVIPNDWEVVEIGDILKIGSGKDYKHLERGSVPVYGTGGYMLSVDKFLYDGESVCIGRKGTIDKPVFLDGKFWTVDTLFYTHSFKNAIPKYVYMLFLNIDWKIYNEASGVPSLSKTTIETIPISLPSLLSEQKKIAEILSTWDDCITKEEQLIEQKKQFKKGVMQHIFSQKIRFKDNNGNDYPAWEAKKLGDVGKIITGRTPNTNNRNLWNGNICFVTPTDMNDNKYQNDTRRYVNSDDLYILPIGSIMYTCIASIGKMSISTKLSVTNQQINSIVVKNNINNEFVYYALANISKYIKSTQSNTTLPIINKNKFSKFMINLPSLSEQTKIADYLTLLDDEISKLSEKLEQLKLQKKALMQKLLTGQVRVKIN